MLRRRGHDSLVALSTNEVAMSSLPRYNSLCKLYLFVMNVRLGVTLWQLGQVHATACLLHIDYHAPPSTDTASMYYITRCGLGYALGLSSRQHTCGESWTIDTGASTTLPFVAMCSSCTWAWREEGKRLWREAKKTRLVLVGFVLLFMVVVDKRAASVARTLLPRKLLTEWSLSNSQIPETRIRWRHD